MVVKSIDFMVVIDYIYRMNLRDLEYLIAVAEHLHFGKAALAVHVSQPTLSMQLKKLEETLGVQLFERSNKQVMLTPMGVDMVARARRILDEAAQMRLVAKSAADPLSGVLRLGLFPTLAPYLLPSLMPALTTAFPKLAVQLVEEKTPALLAQLASGALDCALLAMPVAAEGLAVAPLFREPFLLAVAADHRLAARQIVTFADLARESVLLLEDGHCLRDQALEVCHMAGIGEAKNFRATSLETLRHMVGSSQAVTLMPKLATQPDDPHMRYIAFEAPAPVREIGLYWRKTSARAPLFAAMAAVIAKNFEADAHITA
jgi:LysR family hydrogen peroxide-inducible transcriptional activator